MVFIYFPFGVEKSPDANDTNPIRYAGEYYDKETGTYYLRARYYDPLIARLTQQDTYWNPSNMIYGDEPQKINERQSSMGLNVYTFVPSIEVIMQGGNLYVYCMSNPVLHTDPTGLASYNNTMTNNGGIYSVTTKIQTGSGTVTVDYTIQNGIIQFDYTKNDYGKVANIGGEDTLAKAMYSAAKSINSNYLRGRTTLGIEVELQAHSGLYTQGILTQHTYRADIGGTRGVAVMLDSLLLESN